MSGTIGGVGNVRGPADAEGPGDAAQAAPGVVSGEVQVTRGGAPAGRMAALASVQVQGSYQREAALLEALETEPPEKLEKTLAAAKKEDPVAFRAALREFFRVHVGDQTKLKLHTMAMDANNDGWLTFSESYDTMRDMGFGRLRAFLLSAATSLLLAPKTNDKFSTKLNIANAEKTERAFFLTGFDSKEKLEARLDEIMAEDLDQDGFVTLEDLERLVDKRTAKMESRLGAKAINYLNKGEWQALFSLMPGERMTRDELRDFYKGSLFFSLLEPDNLAKKVVAYRPGNALG